jgi:hypothetical protein
MTIGKQTFGLNKGEYSDKLGRVIKNFRANSRLIGDPEQFVLRSCRLTEQWGKLSNKPDTKVYLRNISLAGGRSVKMLSLEHGNTRQPVGKAKLIQALYPTKSIATSATKEELHCSKVKAAMRNAIKGQIKEYRDSVTYPVTCYITGDVIRKGMRTDVDHIDLSFSEIADKFIEGTGSVYTDIVLIGPPTNKRFNDSTMWQSWQDYHRLKAKYALVSASANRGKGCGDYCTPVDILGSFACEDPECIDLGF